jgi:hypothetical protein
LPAKDKEIERPSGSNSGGIPFWHHHPGADGMLAAFNATSTFRPMGCLT